MSAMTHPITPRRFYVPALIITALVAIGSFFLILRSTAAQLSAYDLIDRSRGQRMYVLTISFLASRLTVASEGAEREALREELKQTISAMTDGFEAMLATPSMSLDLVPNLADQTTRFLQAARDMVNAGSVAVDTPAYQTILALRPPLVTATSALVDQHIRGSTDADRLQFGLLLILLATLGLEGVLIFGPMERHIRRNEALLREEVTRSQEITAALRASEERLRLITDSVQDLVIRSDAEGRITFVNLACRTLLGYEPEVMLGKPSREFIHPDDWACIVDAVRAAFEAADRRLTVEARVIHTSGRAVWTEIVGKVLVDESGNRVGSVSITRDITERKRLQELLMEKEKLQTALDKENELSKLKSRMMERIEHEFRTPLAVIQTATETLTLYLDRLTNEQRTWNARAIMSRIRRITDMLDEIRLVVDGNFAPTSLQPVSIDLGALCQDIARELEAQFDLPGKYEVDLPEAVTVHADPDVLRNGIFHIMRNAARFSKPDSAVRVSLSRLDEQAVELRVADTGVGILPDEQARIFEPFFRGSNFGEIGGLGLGLTIARAAIEAHHGTIAVDSVPGQGTTVKIRLPIRAA